MNLITVCLISYIFSADVTTEGEKQKEMEELTTAKAKLEEKEREKAEPEPELEPTTLNPAHFSTNSKLTSMKNFNFTGTGTLKESV